MWNELGYKGGTAIVILIALLRYQMGSEEMESKKPTVLSLERKLRRYPKRKRVERTWIGFRRSTTSSLWNRPERS